MKYLIIYLLELLVLFIIFLINKKRKVLGLNKALQYIDKKYDINMNENRVNKLSFILVLVNSVIIGIPSCIALTNINYWLLLAISLIWFIISILVFYNLIGIILKKKWEDKNGI